MALGEILRLRKRAYAPDDTEVVADLDAMLSETVAFKFGGKKHVLKPLTTADYMRVVDQYSNLLNRRKDQSITAEQLEDAYADLFSQCCSTIGRAEVRRMTPQQIGSLFDLIISAVSGRAQGEAKKKSQVSPQIPKT